MTKVDLMVLGLLSEESMHGYQLKQVLESNHTRLWSEVSTGHLYYTLKKLEKDSFVNERETRVGKRPPRRVYTITDAGREALKTGLDNLDVHTQRLYFSLDIVIGFSRNLNIPKGKLHELLKKRKDSVTDEIAELKDAWKIKGEDGLSLSEYMIYEHRMALLNGELKWLKWAMIVAKDANSKALQSTNYEKGDAPYALP